MENTTNVSKNALQYRLIVNEIVGIIITFALTTIIAIVLYFLKLKFAYFIDGLIFLSVFILQFIVIYLVSIMQYRNLKYMIGQNSISFQRGAFALERETIPFEKIKNSTFDQSILQRMFKVGDITIEQEENQEYTWENIDTDTATLISNAVGVRGDVQPITLAALNTLTTPTQPTQPTE